MERKGKKTSGEKRKENEWKEKESLSEKEMVMFDKLMCRKKVVSWEKFLIQVSCREREKESSVIERE